MNPKYDYETGFPGNDVAIVQLIYSIEFSEQDHPICIVESFRENIGDVAYVAGYGSASGQCRVILVGPDKNHSGSLSAIRLRHGNIVMIIQNSVMEHLSIPIVLDLVDSVRLSKS